MKKFTLALTLLLLFALAACGEEKTMSSADQKANSNGQQKSEQKAEKKEKKEAKIEVQDEAYSAWKDSIGTVWANYSAVLKNTGNGTAKLGDVQANFNGKDDSVLATASMFTPTPDVVLPGKTAFVSVTVELEGSEPEDLDSATLNVDFDTTDADVQKLDVKNPKYTKTDYGTYKVTGKIVNNSGDKADDVRVAAALYDKDGKLLGVLDGSVDVSINKGSETGFEVSYPELNPDIKGKVAEVKTHAYNWTMMDYKNDQTKKKEAAAAPDPVKQKGLNNAEQMTLDFINVMNGTDKEKKQAFIEKNVQKDSQMLFSMISNESLGFENAKIKDSKSFKEDGKTADLVLIEYTDSDTKEKHEAIAVIESDKILMLYGDDAEDSEAKSTFEQMRSQF